MATQSRRKKAPGNIVRKAGHLTKVFMSLLGTVLVLAIAGAIGLFLVAQGLDRPAATITQGGALFTVERGELGTPLARRLEREGLIRSSLFFRALLMVGSKGSDLKAGTYRISENMSTSAILELLRSGREVLTKLTVPEGFTLSQTAKLLEDSGIVGRAAFSAAATDAGILSKLGIPAASAEGYLFPDTYYFAKSSGAETVLKTFTETFKERMESELPEIVTLSPEELRKRVILASIVEREYRVPEEAALMAGIFYNRLKKGIKLQSCATVVYVITETRKKPHPERLLFADLEIDDPYNTYLYEGLPPGPISSPGLVALRAAFRPAPSSYLYFRLTDPASGRHSFSETYNEHLDAASLVVKGPGS